MFKSTKSITCSFWHRNVVKIEFQSTFFEFLSNKLFTSPTWCVYLSSIRFSFINEIWKLKSTAVHLDWFHLKQNVKKKNQSWNKHFSSFHLRKIAVRGLIFYFSPFSFETQNKKLLSSFAFLTFHLNQIWNYSHNLKIYSYNN